MAAKTLIAALACAASVSAHGYIEKIVADGQSHVGYNPSNAPWQEDQGSVAWTYWATDLGFLFENNLSTSVKIPSDIKPGNYVLRHEIIALHEGLEQGGAQFYPQCINLKISGGGSKSPEGTVATELYQSNDPGVLYNIYNDEKHPTYTIPGPKLYNA
ncbi:unnamed protein product [Clonostachys rosea f. rosea IK726]|uniref:lytic cellulose monooxygenase (C4-dehydrogenating) n=2 Tax=Bionectria ochroleuca TaxID=29856 RepID=A0A0B7KFQ0_BIOOC|nr:unnamed protein product [Clonostachys rosea f. rosea IK726]